MYTVPIWVGLFLTGIYVMTHEHVVRAFPESMENKLAALLLFGSTLCLVGASLGTRWVMPTAKLATSYWLEIVGLVCICVALGAEAVRVDLTLAQQFTMAGSLGAILQIGSLRFIVMLLLALRHGRHPAINA
jgi:FtsH-binding integral membrane protein